MQEQKQSLESKKIEELIQELLNKYGCIPPIDLMKENYSEFVNAVQKRHGGFDPLREKYNNKISRLFSFDGQKWDSFAETNLCNYLWARGIQVFSGAPYPVKYKEVTNRKFGKYDLEFIGTVPPYSNIRLKMEIWGSINWGREAEMYAVRRRDKELFNENDPYFIGIEYDDCYNDDKLSSILQKFIGSPGIINISDKSLKHFDSSLWSLTNFVLEKCKFICKNIDGSILPSGEWMKKCGKYKSREIFDWEPSTWGRLPDYITEIGGFRKVRETLGQSKHNKTVWNREKVIEMFADVYKKYGKWPGQIKYNLKNNHDEKQLFLSMKMLCEQAGKYGGIEHIKCLANKFLSNILYEKHVVVPKLPTGVRISGDKYRATITINGKKNI